MSALSCLGEQFESVLLSAQHGEAWALGRLYENLQPAVLAYLQAQDPEAEDIAADSWIAVARGLGTFTGDEDAFRRFVFSIARRRLIDVRRMRGRRRTRPAPPEHLESGTHDPGYEAVERDEAARAIVASLPEGQAQVVLLRVLGDFTVAEVAQILRKRPGAIRALQHRAVRQLAKKFPSPRNARMNSNDVKG